VQKIVIFMQIINLVIQSLGAKKLLLSTAYRVQPVEFDQVAT